MIRAYCTCKKCKKQLETYSKIERLAELKRSIELWKHYKKEHGINIFIPAIKHRIKRCIYKKINQLR